MIDDPFDLARFTNAQETAYDTALREISNGQKRSHWMWFVFPQIDGLGSSPTAQFYSIRSRAEAEAYIGHPLLGARLIACAEAALQCEDRSATEIFGYPDDVKLRSSATLFAAVSGPDSVFHRVLEKFFDGSHDGRTLDLLDQRTTGGSIEE